MNKIGDTLLEHDLRRLSEIKKSGIAQEFFLKGGRVRVESLYMNGEHCKIKSARIALAIDRPQITRTSAEKAAKILSFSQIGT